jgi:hypothetical protein
MSEKGQPRNAGAARLPPGSKRSGSACRQRLTAAPRSLGATSHVSTTRQEYVFDARLRALIAELPALRRAAEVAPSDIAPYLLALADDAERHFNERLRSDVNLNAADFQKSTDGSQQQKRPIQADAVAQLVERGAIFLEAILLAKMILMGKMTEPVPSAADGVCQDDFTSPIYRKPFDLIKSFAKSEEDLNRRVREEDEISRALQVQKLSRLYYHLDCSMLEFILHLAAKAYPGFQVVEGGKKSGAGNQNGPAHVAFN